MVLPKIVAETEAEYGVKFEYGQREGGYLDPVIPRPEGWKEEDRRGNG
uniref:Uncharacterized protein n=1 Tax=Candidatus Kentrum sp. DK TaxID=2126562 RepID=A0A450TLF3_9GAMM|nr:MAG: hypothetical protein BECKDK2373B_GA0170837_104113 [Candidatus Kentron sp. DK]VFJ68573.1 MAG: hypothetical protein BECKDK2373C_GA0170839_11876 [Candidatus Kentron sp. DK]